MPRVKTYHYAFCRPCTYDELYDGLIAPTGLFYRFAHGNAGFYYRVKKYRLVYRKWYEGIRRVSFVKHTNETPTRVRPEGRKICTIFIKWILLNRPYVGVAVDFSVAAILRGSFPRWKNRTVRSSSVKYTTRIQGAYRLTFEIFLWGDTCFIRFSSRISLRDCRTALCSPTGNFHSSLPLRLHNIGKTTNNYFSGITALPLLSGRTPTLKIQCGTEFLPYTRVSWMIIFLVVFVTLLQFSPPAR